LLFAITSLQKLKVNLYWCRAVSHQPQYLVPCICSS